MALHPPELSQPSLNLLVAQRTVSFRGGRGQESEDGGEECHHCHYAMVPTHKQQDQP